MELNLGFMASHSGSNFQAIVDNIEKGNLIATAKVLISNNSDAKVLERAKQAGVSSYCFNSKVFPDFLSEEDAIIQTMEDYKVNLVVLAGYMKKIGEGMIEAYPNGILNIHPALLPRYGGEGMYGARVHEAVIASDDEESGATVHIVNEEYDLGKILAQCKVPRYKTDTIETLSVRVLGVEHVLYTQVLRDIQRGLINLDG